jgi:hypothetical protein
VAINTVHHWRDLRAGLCELRRVARKRVVIFLRDPARGTPFWLTEDYVSSLDPAGRMATIVATIHDELSRVRVVPVACPRDCADGLFTAYWARPEAYLDGGVRCNISTFVLAANDDVAAGLARLRSDLESGIWDSRYGRLRSLPELDLGHCLVISGLR